MSCWPVGLDPDRVRVVGVLIGTSDHRILHSKMLNFNKMIKGKVVRSVGKGRLAF